MRADNKTIVQIVCLLFCTAAIADQYHIQTDEGPERYFRFQTNNGQFRKEKRLPDGTVIGTEAWIDADGFLRLKDYMADKQGFRILKSKTVFVGVSKPIDDAIKYTKSLNTNFDSPKSNKYNFNTESNRVDEEIKRVQPHSPSTLRTSPIFTEEPILGYKTPSELLKLQPIPYLGFDHYPNEVPETPKTSQDTLKLLSNNKSTFAAANHRKIQAIAIAPIKPSAIAGNTARSDFSTLPPSNILHTYGTPAHFSTYSPQQNLSPSVLHSEVNALDDQPLPSLLPPLHKYDKLSDNDVTYSSNAFRYILPHQYHEEVYIDPNQKVGSFGYVDPFGIRRVVYYNASPNKGFIHRNHNTFVGINGKPYDQKQPTTDHHL